MKKTSKSLVLGLLSFLGTCSTMAVEKNAKPNSDFNNVMNDLTMKSNKSGVPVKRQNKIVKWYKNLPLYGKIGVPASPFALAAVVGGAVAYATYDKDFAKAKKILDSDTLSIAEGKTETDNLALFGIAEGNIAYGYDSVPTVDEGSTQIVKVNLKKGKRIALNLNEEITDEQKVKPLKAAKSWECKAEIILANKQILEVDKLFLLKYGQQDEEKLEFLFEIPEKKGSYCSFSAATKKSEDKEERESIYSIDEYSEKHED